MCALQHHTCVMYRISIGDILHFRFLLFLSHLILQYDAGKLGESNKDALDNDLLGLIKSSSDKLLQHLFRRLETESTEDGGAAAQVSVLLR